MAWNDAVITNSGLGLLSEVLAGKSLTISAAGAGGGTVEAAALMVQTGVTQALAGVSVMIAATSDLKQRTGKEIKLQIRNTGLTEAARMKQIGLFAYTDSEPVLFAIMQDETGENIPTESEYPDFMIEFTAAVALSQTDGITVEISGSAVITAGMLGDTLGDYSTTEEVNKALESKADAETLTAHTDNKNNPHNVTKMQLGLGNVENKSSKDIRSEITKEDINAALGYTPTEYTHPTYTARTGVPTANQTPAFGATFSVTQPVSDDTGHITGMTTRTVKIPNTAASANAAGLMNTGAQTFAGAKTFNASVYPNGATAYGTPQARKLASGTAAATTTNCPEGAWYGQHS